MLFCFGVVIACIVLLPELCGAQAAVEVVAEFGDGGVRAEFFEAVGDFGGVEDESRERELEDGTQVGDVV